MMYMWNNINEERNKKDAETLRYKNLWNGENGITKIDYSRWKIAQQRELEYWYANTPLQQRSFNCLLLRKYLNPDFGKVIEIGCGPNPQYVYYCNKLTSITLLDPLLEKYTQLESCQYADNVRLPNVDLVSEMIESIKWTEEYDTVLCIGCIEHVLNAEVALDNIIKLTKKGGQIIIIERIFDYIPEEYYDERRPIKITKEFINNRTSQLERIKEVYQMNIHNFDVDLKTETLIGIYKKI